MRFEYWVELREGYQPTMQSEKETEIRIVIEAKNRVTADRMIKAMLGDADNVVSWDGICIE